jgi:hypothetical protein
MNLVFMLCVALLVISSALICYADLKEREVALWILLAFGINTVASVILFQGLEIFMYHTTGTLVYMGFIWLILKGYLYIRYKKNRVILDEQLGKADVLIIFFIGITFNFPGMILFFCFGFVFSLLVFMLVPLKHAENVQTIPLAGLLVFFYIAGIILLNLVPLELIECSFVKP